MTIKINPILIDSALGKAAVHRPPVTMFGKSGKYLNALYSAASNSKRLDTLAADFRVIKLFTETEAYHLLNLPMKVTRKLETMKILIESENISPLVANFLNIIANNDDCSELIEICRQYEKIRRIVSKEVHIKINSAKKLEKEVIDQIIEVIRKDFGKDHSIISEEAVDASLLGGFTIEFNDKVLDMSIKSRVKDIISRI
ncbi:MAG: ATP synthase subunit O, mitochondrial [Marteilia pararefringens]